MYNDELLGDLKQGFAEATAVMQDSSGANCYAATVPCGRWGVITDFVPPDNNAAVRSSFLVRVSIPVPTTIDIKPGDDKNIVSVASNGGVWVAVLSDTENEVAFDPLQIDIPTVRLGPGEAEPIRHRVRDVNHDGLGDLLFRFSIPETGIQCGDTEATLTGEAGGVGFSGTDALQTVGCG